MSMKSYKHANGRIQAQSGNGRLRAFALGDFGITANAERLICGKCGHGKRGDFFPILPDGECPKCDNTAGHIPLKQWLNDLIGAGFGMLRIFGRHLTQSRSRLRVYQTTVK
jgi:hypothetical protein